MQTQNNDLWPQNNHVTYHDQLNGQQFMLFEENSIDQNIRTNQSTEKNNNTKDSNSSFYTTSITQLISQPAQENYYSMEYIKSSLYQLSDYLFTKKLLGNSQQNLIHQEDNNITFDQYLKPLEEQFNKYDKFKKSKAKQEAMYIYDDNDLNNNQQQLTNNRTPNKKSDINNLNPLLTKKKIISLQSQMNKCYQKVPFLYFQSNFYLDFSPFQDQNNRLKYNNTLKMIEEQQKMNQHLDIIQINLFGQIHRKFQDYFKAASNFYYLRQSIGIQLNKLKEARSRMKKVNLQFIQKSSKLRKKIIQRNNIQKILKKIKILKSLKKLPQIIQTILQSSLPYECLELLKSTKKSFEQVKKLDCLKSTLRSIESSEKIVQIGLNKRYTDELYMYIEESFSLIDFNQQFKRVTKKMSSDMSGGILEGSGQNQSRTLNNLSTNSNNMNESFREKNNLMLLEELDQKYHSSKNILKNSLAKRQQGKQYQISMILLQSYEFVDFPVDVTKIKITNGLRVICKKFQKQLSVHFKRELDKALQNRQKSIMNDLSLGEADKIQTQKPLISVSKQIDQDDLTEQLKSTIQQISIQFYIKHINILNQLFKQSLNRYLGYILSLITQYEQRLMKKILEIDQTGSNQKISNKSLSNKSIDDDLGIQKKGSQLDQLYLAKSKSIEKSQRLSKMEIMHNKFKQILSQQLSLLPSIFKIIEEKIKYFLTLKNISHLSPYQFYKWLSLLRYWQQWFDTFIQESILINYSCTHLTSHSEISSSTQLVSLGQDMIEQLIQIVVENIKKSINVMNIKNLITELTINYLNTYANSIKTDLAAAIAEETWQSVEIPQEFGDILNGIIMKSTDQNHNMSLTILNSSSGGSFLDNSMNNDASIKGQKDNNENNGDIQGFKYKILKNNILIQGQRYKLTISFLFLCEYIEEMIKISRLFLNVTGQTDPEKLKQSKNIKKIQSIFSQKIFQLIQFYNFTCKQMILQKKALKLQKIKGNITVKHICLLSNCLTFLGKIVKEMGKQTPVKQRQEDLIQSLTSHNTLLIDKISSILSKKVQVTVNNLKSKQAQKVPNLLSVVIKSDQDIGKMFIQITEIIDEYLDVEACEKILRSPFQLFLQKYFKVVILKGGKFVEEAKILMEKIKFLKKYFKNQFAAMQREIQ